MPTATPNPRRLPVPGTAFPRPADGFELAEDPWLAEDPGPPPWPADDAGWPPAWLAGDPGPGDPHDIIGWLDTELAKAAPWLAADPDWDDGQPPGPTPQVEAFKAGRWDRSRGDGGGFAAGGLADHLPPGPVLAGLAGDRWQTGLGKLSDDELIGVLRAARRLTSWAAAMELAAVGDLWRRRTADEDAGETGAAWHADAELAAALTLTRRSADHLLALAAGLGRLPATTAALAAGTIDLPRAEVIAAGVTGLTDEHAAAVEAAIIAAAPRQTTGQLRRAVHRAVLAADPDAARQRKEQALREARVERWSEPAGTAALAGRDLPPAAVLAADANLTALAKQLKAAGGVGTLDALRAQIYLALLTGAPVSSLLPASAGDTCPPSTDPASADRASTDSPAGASGLASTGAIGPANTDSPAGASGLVSTGTAGPAGGRPAGASGLASTGTADPAGGRPVDTSGPPSASPTAAGFPAAGSPAAGSPAAGSPATSSRATASAAQATGSSDPGALRVTGRVNLTVPLATWLGHSDAPGHASGYGPLDATDTRALADALAAYPGTNWCLTFTGPDGRPVAHGCAHSGAHSGAHPQPPRRPRTRTRDRPGTGPPARPDLGPQHTRPTSTVGKPEPRPPDGASTKPGHRPTAGTRDGPGTWARPTTWTLTLTLTPLARDGCDHSWETLAYRPSAALRHLVNLRHATCVFPTCGRPAAQCDADHTLAYETGGKTCLCNLAPLCRHHHQVKQTPGWTLEQTTPGTLTWTSPSGRRYTIGPTSYHQ